MLQGLGVTSGGPRIPERVAKLKCGRRGSVHDMCGMKATAGHWLDVETPAPAGHGLMGMAPNRWTHRVELLVSRTKPTARIWLESPAETLPHPLLTPFGGHPRQVRPTGVGPNTESGVRTGARGTADGQRGTYNPL